MYRIQSLSNLAANLRCYAHAVPTQTKSTSTLHSSQYPPKVAVLLYCGLQPDAFQGPISNRADDGDKAYKMHCTATHDLDSGSYNKHAERDLKEFQDFNFFLK